MNSLLSRVDHLVWATPDLAAEVERIESLTGVRATSGGPHLGRGTRNFLLALGGRAYLEIIGPDLEQPEPAGARPFGVDSLAGPRLLTWAVSAPDIDRVVGSCIERGYDPGGIVSMSRESPAGGRLDWRLTLPAAGRLPDGGGAQLVPFLIDWGEASHPSATSASGCRLTSLRAGHPEPLLVEPLLRALEVPLQVEPTEVSWLEAEIETPRGKIVLR